MNDLLSKLAKELNALGFQGELEKDWSFRTAASTDNSIYQIEPDAVAYPTSAADVRVFLDVLNQHSFDDIHLTARGAATGTNGQSLNTGIVLDFRRHMTSAGERNLDEGWIDVEPGISLDRVNHELDGSRLFFAPDTSTANRCTIGGMISTDACGQGSRVFGKTSDNILELNVLLADGSALTLRPISDDELDRKIAEGDASAAALQRMRMVKASQRSRLMFGHYWIAMDWPMACSAMWMSGAFTFARRSMFRTIWTAGSSKRFPIGFANCRLSMAGCFGESTAKVSGASTCRMLSAKRSTRHLQRSNAHSIRPTG